MLESNKAARTSSSRNQESELCARIERGDSAALGTVYDVYGGLVYSIALRVGRDPVLAEDITQEVFVELWQRPQRYDSDRGTLRTYLAMLAHRRTVDHVRSEVARTAREQRLDSYASSQSSTEESVLSRLDATRANKLLETLPASQRSCIELAYFGGLTYREVALRLGIAEGTAKSRIRLALQRLRQSLDAAGGLV